MAAKLKGLLWVMSSCLMFLAALLARLSTHYGPPHTNYDASVHFDHTHLRSPSSKAEIIKIVKWATEKGQKVRVVGSGHSWSSVAVGDNIQISLWNYTGIVKLDLDEMQVTVKAGTTLRELNKLLNDQGLAMKNLGSISEQTVAGAISTGTHGNGVWYGNLATLVTGLEFVNGKGELVTAGIGQNLNIFKAVQVSVGMLGIITEVTISVETAYFLREVLTQHTLDVCLDDFDVIMKGGDHVKMWIELFTGTCGVFTVNRTSETSPRDNPCWTFKNIEVLASEGLLLATSFLPYSITPLVMALISSSLFSPYDRTAASYDVLQVPHYLPPHWESEVVVPFRGCPEAIRRLRKIILDDHIPANMPIEVRPVMGDDIWLSPNYDRLSCHVTLTLYHPTSQSANDYFQKFYDATHDLKPRVHWGKYVTRIKKSDLHRVYPRMTDFNSIRAEMDPHEIFINSALKNDFGF